MKDIKSILIMLLLLSSIVSVSAAADIPRIEPYVNDFAGLLTPEEELQLNILADEIEINTTFEIAIVTINGTGGQDRVEFAGKIGDLNGVGKKDADNGVVVMWSTADDFGGAIATGRGSESFLTDSTVGRIGRESRGYFDKGEYAVAFDYILIELNKEIIKHQTNPVPISDADSDGIPWFEFIFSSLIMIGIFVIISIMSDYSEEDGKHRSTGLSAVIASTMMNDDDDDDDDSSSSGSSSFGSFGGGSFGGGGAGF